MITSRPNANTVHLASTEEAAKTVCILPDTLCCHILGGAANGHCNLYSVPNLALSALAPCKPAGKMCGSGLTLADPKHLLLAIKNVSHSNRKGKLDDGSLSERRLIHAAGKGLKCMHVCLIVNFAAALPTAAEHSNYVVHCGQ